MRRAKLAKQFEGVENILSDTLVVIWPFFRSAAVGNLRGKNEIETSYPHLSLAVAAAAAAIVKALSQLTHLGLDCLGCAFAVRFLLVSYKDVSGY